jgi:hypothetical protein
LAVESHNCKLKDGTTSCPSPVYDYTTDLNASLKPTTTTDITSKIVYGSAEFSGWLGSGTVSMAYDAAGSVFETAVDIPIFIVERSDGLSAWMSGILGMSALGSRIGDGDCLFIKNYLKSF